jgi:predicted amidohydrolase YtcJ
VGVDTTMTSRTMAADRGTARGTLVTADRVVTLGHGRKAARALVVRGSRVVWVGDDPAQAPPHGGKVDLPGCVVGPAFVDAHVHLTPMGLALTGLDLTEVASGAELLQAVATYADAHTGRVIWGHGFDPHDFADELPTSEDLARVAEGRSVYLSQIDGHASLVDRRTLAAAPLARSEGIERDGDGNLTGMLRREANHIVRRWSVGAMEDAELAAARREAIAHAASLGVGSVHEMASPDVMGIDDLDAWIEGTWPIEVVPYWAGLDIQTALARDLRQVGGDLFLDGSLGAHTAALSRPYHDRPAATGNLEFDDETLTAWFLEAARAGLQTAVHAIGDASIAQAIRCWRAVATQLEADGHYDAVRRGRHRLEHAELLSTELLDEVADLGLVISAQPAYETKWGQPGGLYERRLGPERAPTTNPFRAIADRGIGLAFGSDANVTPMDPWSMVVAAERRRHEEHAVSRLEAVSMSTLGGRHAARQERYVGVVRAGMRADIAAFEGDPYRADDPRGTRCVATIVHGRVAHGDIGLPDAPGRAPTRTNAGGSARLSR